MTAGVHSGAKASPGGLLANNRITKQIDPEHQEETRAKPQQQDSQGTSHQSQEQRINEPLQNKQLRISKDPDHDYPQPRYGPQSSSPPESPVERSSLPNGKLPALLADQFRIIIHLRAHGMHRLHGPRGQADDRRYTAVYPPSTMRWAPVT